MSEAKHPYWARAEALVSESRFCEWLDATSAHPSGWPHNRNSARCWLLERCQLESLGRLAVDPHAAGVFCEIELAFAVWDRNQELEV